MEPATALGPRSCSLVLLRGKCVWQCTSRRKSPEAQRYFPFFLQPVERLQSRPGVRLAFTSPADLIPQTFLRFSRFSPGTLTPCHSRSPVATALCPHRLYVPEPNIPDSADETWAEVGELADIVKPKATDRASFLEEARSGAFDGCTVAYRTFESFDVTGKVDEEMLAALPQTLRYICHNGAGYDQVDVSACTGRGIRVSNTPTAVDDATADMGIFLMLGALRNLAASMASLRAGQWRGKTLPVLGHDPQGKVLGILGMGGIGRNFARKAFAFGMKIRYYNRTRLDEAVEKEIGAEYVDFATLLRESDVLSLNLPLNVSFLAPKKIPGFHSQTIMLMSPHAYRTTRAASSPATSSTK